MAIRRPTFFTGAKSDANATVRGTALAAEYATAAFPESERKRKEGCLYNKVPTAGAAPKELTHDDMPGFRLRLGQTSVALLQGRAVYIASNLSTGASQTREAFTFAGAFQNLNGVLSAVAAPVVTKVGASAVALAITTDNATEAVVFTGTGLAGDTNGFWVVDYYLTEITELGG